MEGAFSESRIVQPKMEVSPEKMGILTSIYTLFLESKRGIAGGIQEHPLPLDITPAERSWFYKEAVHYKSPQITNAEIDAFLKYYQVKIIPTKTFKEQQRKNKRSTTAPLLQTAYRLKNTSRATVTSAGTPATFGDLAGHDVEKPVIKNVGNGVFETVEETQLGAPVPDNSKPKDDHQSELF